MKATEIKKAGTLKNVYNYVIYFDGFPVKKSEDQKEIERDFSLLKESLRNAFSEGFRNAKIEIVKEFKYQIVETYK